MVHVKTSAGFEVDLDEKRFNDLELIDALVHAGDGNMMSFVTLVDRLLGEKKKDLYDFMRDEDGRVPIDATMNLLGEIIKEATPKND